MRESFISHVFIVPFIRRMPPVPEDYKGARRYSYFQYSLVC